MCIGCFYPLTLDKFNKHTDGQYGKRARCKKCFASYRKGGSKRLAQRKALQAKGKRKCKGCNKTKSLSQFHPRTHANGSEGWEGKCKPCVAIRMKENYKHKNKDTRKLVFDYLKKHPCVDCGENNVLALEFDHVHSKKFDIGDALNRNTTIDLIKKEMKKCVIRCSTCHRIKTHLEINSWRFQMSLQDKDTSNKVKRTKQYKALKKVA